MEWTQVVFLYGPFDGLPMTVPDIQAKLEFRVGSVLSPTGASIITPPADTSMYYRYERLDAKRFVYKGLYERKPVEPLPGLEPL